LKGAVVREGGGSVAYVVAEIFFAGKRAPTVYRATPETIGVRKSVGAGLLANAVGQVLRRHGLVFFAGKRAPTVDRAILETIGITSPAWAVCCVLKKTIPVWRTTDAPGARW
jgi:hypothetical protein